MTKRSVHRTRNAPEHSDKRSKDHARIRLCLFSSSDMNQLWRVKSIFQPLARDIKILIDVDNSHGSVFFRATEGRLQFPKSTFDGGTLLTGHHARRQYKSNAAAWKVIDESHLAFLDQLNALSAPLKDTFNAWRCAILGAGGFSDLESGPHDCHRPRIIPSSVCWSKRPGWEDFLFDLIQNVHQPD